MSTSVIASTPISDARSKLLTARELEGRINIDVKTIYAYVQRGLIPYVRIQSNIRFRREEILDWIERQSNRTQHVNPNGARKR